MLPAVLDAFNRFKAPYMLRLKAEEPALSQREFLKRAAILWHTAPENPKNGCQAAAAGEAAGAEGAAGGGAVDDEPALDGAGAGGSGDEMEAAAQAMLMVARAPEGEAAPAMSEVDMYISYLESSRVVCGLLSCCSS